MLYLGKIMGDFINKLILLKKFEKDVKEEGGSVKLKYAMLTM